MAAFLRRMGDGKVARRGLRFLPRIAAVGLIFVSSFARAFVQITLGMTGQPVPTHDTLLERHGPVAVSGQLYADPGNLFLSANSSVAAAAADLTAGTLRVYVAANVLQPLPAGGPVGLPNATAAFGDMITVSGPGTSVMASATLDVSGLFTISGPQTTDGNTQQIIASSISLGDYGPIGHLFFERDFQRLNGMDTDIFQILPVDAGISVANGSAGSPAASVTVHYVATIGAPTPISADITFYGGGTVDYSVTADFGNTARLSISLPAGYTYTSRSGVLLSQAGSPGLSAFADGGSGDDGGTGGGNDGGGNVDAGHTKSTNSGGGCSSVGGEVGCWSALTVGFLLIGLRLRFRRSA